MWGMGDFQSRRRVPIEPTEPTTTRTTRARKSSRTKSKAKPAAPRVALPKVTKVEEELPPSTHPDVQWEGDVPSVQGLLKGAPRQTLPTNANVLGALPWAFLPRRQYQDLDLTSLTPGAYSPQQMMELLADAWPDVGLALWNWMRLCAAEWEYTVRSPDNTTEDEGGKKLLDALVDRLNPHFGGFEAILQQWTMTTSLEGACAGETIPTPDIDGVEDLVAVQPWTIYFQRDLLQHMIPFQWQPMLAAGGAAAMAQVGTYPTNPGTDVVVPDPTASSPSTAELLIMRALDHGGFRRLNPFTFAYVPLDTQVDDPYGRMPFAPILQLIAFDAQLLKDLRQWSHVNAFGRIDVKIVAESAEKLMPPNIRQNYAERAKWFQQYLTEVQAAFNGINPDDSYIHWDNVEVGSTESAGQTFNVDDLIRIVERRMFRALKQLPILMGSNEGTTETWGTLQMEVYALGIQSVQRTVAKCAEHLLNAALRLMGSPSRCHFEFKALRATDRLKLAIAEKQEIQNEAAKRDEGWQTQDEASQTVTGSKAVVQKGPEVDPLAANSAAGGGQPNVANGGADEQPAAGDEEPEAKGDKPEADTDAASGKDAKPADADESKPPKKAGKPSKPKPPQSGKKPPKDESKPQRLRQKSGENVLQSSGSAGWTKSGLTRSISHNSPPIPPERLALVESLRGQMAAHFRAAKVSADLLRSISNLHASRARALGETGSRITESGTLTDDERAALVASIAVMLARAFPAGDAQLTALLVEARLAAWNAGGQAALRRLEIREADNSGHRTFALTNAALLHRNKQTTAKHVAGIQHTTRLTLARVLASDLEAGDDEDHIAADVEATLAQMADAGQDEDGHDVRSRAALIASYEIGDAWGEASVETWGRNGVDQKVWTTNGHPDPGSAEKPCQDNEDAGAIPITDSFPSGADWPPEHPGCYCQADAVTPDDYEAPDAPWTGD